MKGTEIVFGEKPRAGKRVEPRRESPLARLHPDILTDRELT